MQLLKTQGVSKAEVELLREFFEKKLTETAKNKDIERQAGRRNGREGQPASGRDGQTAGGHQATGQADKIRRIMAMSYFLSICQMKRYCLPSSNEVKCVR